MPKIKLGSALLEKEEADSVTCKTCAAPADDEHDPYCMSCAIYWKDVENGLFDDKCPIHGMSECMCDDPEDWKPYTS